MTQNENSGGGENNDENERPRSGGKYVAEYADEDFLDAIEDIDGPAYSTAISDIVGCSDDLVRRRMKQLVDEGEATSDRVGTTLVWHRA